MGDISFAKRGCILIDYTIPSDRVLLLVDYAIPPNRICFQIGHATVPNRAFLMLDYFFFEILQKGENVRGAAQKFERSVSNEEEKKQQQQPVRWKRTIYPKNFGEILFPQWKSRKKTSKSLKSKSSKSLK